MSEQNEKGQTEELEKLVEERVEELRQDLKKEAKEEALKENQELREEVEQLKTQSNTFKNTKTSNKRISRRQFLKKAGLGTAGLAALMSPASALNVKSDSFSVFTEQNQNAPYFSVDSGGPVNIQNTYLDLNNQGIRNLGDLELPQQEPEENKENRIWINPDNKQLKIKIGGNTYTAEIQSSAIPDSAIEDFEWGGPVGDRYDGNTGAADIQQNTILEGDWSLRMEETDATISIFADLSEFEYEILRGDKFQVLVRPQNSQNFRSEVHFAVNEQDNSNRYTVFINVSAGEFGLRKDNDPQDTSTAALSANTTYIISVDFGFASGDTITATIEDDDATERSVSFTDTAYDSGAFGWAGNRAAGGVDPDVVYDKLRVTDSAAER